MSADVNLRIRERRKAIGLKQSDLAKSSGLSQAQISRYESGVNEPTAQALYALATALKTTADYLVGLTEEVSPELRSTEDEFLSIIRQFPPEKREEVLARLRFELEISEKH